MARTIRSLPAESTRQRRARIRQVRSENAMRDFRRSEAWRLRDELSPRDFESMLRGFSPLPSGEGW